ncbi:MAG TPA: YciI family protein [Candidatus Limnocylindria bacterium]|nr:YciI family protein [Candidatus Limnocylindria bacterium]
MKYMMLIAGSEEAWAGRSEEDLTALYGRIEAWWDEHAKAGRIVEGHELQPSATATTVRIAQDGSATVTDGPFVEGKEMVGGYGILEVANLDEALAVASTWPAPDALEIRPIVVRD